MDYDKIQKEIKRAKKLAKTFSEQIEPVYKEFDWWWFRLGRPPQKEEIYNQIMAFIDNLKVDDNFKEFETSTGGLQLKAIRQDDTIEIDLLLNVSANEIEAMDEL